MQFQHLALRRREKNQEFKTNPCLRKRRKKNHIHTCSFKMITKNWRDGSAIESTAVSPKDPASVPSTHTVSHNHP